jgi:hypothetical protein
MPHFHKDNFIMRGVERQRLFPGCVHDPAASCGVQPQTAASRGAPALSSKSDAALSFAAVIVVFSAFWSSFLEGDLGVTTP